MYRVILLASISVLGCSSGLAAAQETAPSAQPAVIQASESTGDIIVTARKRDETSLAVPVVVTAVGMQELQRRAISNLDGIARIVPQLIVAPQAGSVQGGNIVLRGIAGPDTNPFGDQAVSFNVDGVAIGKATVRRMSETDIQQIEVLKGPQALFYGKNSPAGIVSIRTADPTDAFEARVSAGYELRAREVRLEGYVSTPLTDDLGIRIAGFASDLNGFLRNNIPSTAYVAPTSERRTPYSRDYAGRVTLKWEPSDRFSARFKFNYGQTRNSGPGATAEYISCPFGSPQSGSIDSCKADRYVINPGSGPIVGTLNPAFKDGRNYQRQSQILSSLELNYKLADEVNVTSVTGYYYAKLRQAQNFENDYSIALPSTNFYDDREISQELRIQSSYDGPLNFTVGGYFATTKANTGSNTFLFATELSGQDVLAQQGLGFIPFRTPFQINNYRLQQKGTAYSAFAQLVYKPVDVIEIDLGGRYSYEKKRLPVVLSQPTGFGNPFSYVPLEASDDVPASAVFRRKDSWNDFSPEVTVSYRPTQRFTLFASYKHGFLSGGFNSGAGVSGAELNFDQTTIKGFEAGLKALLLDNRLRVNLSGYTYTVSGLQVSVDRNAMQRIVNAAGAKVKGIEADLNYQPVAGLSLRAAAAYNDARYSKFLDAPCFVGQTIAQGCAINELGAPVQNLKGDNLPRAPKWSLSGGVGYDIPLGDTLKLALSLDATFNSSMSTELTNDRAARMPRYALLDGAIRLGNADDTWEFALIGRNLTDKYYYIAAPQVPFTGGPAGGVSGIPGDHFASVSRGREVILRASYKFGR